jgi:RNA polymerase sigma-70 factor (ECF subfamily)
MPSLSAVSGKEVMENADNLFHAGYIEGLKARNSTIEEHFVSYFCPRLRSLLRRNGAPVDDVDDLQQETFLRVLTAIESSKAVRFPERFGGFVGAVCKNTLRERFRRHKQYAESDDSVSEMADESQDQHALLVAGERRESIRRLISRLSRRDQQVLRRVFLEEQSPAEICRDLEVSRAHLRLLLHRAKRRFADQIASDEQRQLEICQTNPRKEA